MGVIRTLILILLMINLSHSYGAIADNKNSLKNILIKINSLEKELNKNNSKLIDMISMKKNIQNELKSYQERVEKNNVELNKQAQDVDDLIKQAIIAKNSSGLNVGSLLANDILLSSLKKKKVEIEQKLNFQKHLEKEYASAEMRMNEYVTFEQEILKLISELEKNKEHFISEYVELEKQQNNKKKITALAKAKQMVVNNSLNSRGKFIAPIDSFTGVDRKKDKGITFTFSEVQVVKAPKQGKILYAGDISPYGNVIMIMHEENFQTVILGEFTPKVHKGDKVKIGDILGYTKVSVGVKGKMYFEIRHNNKITDTVSFLDKNKISI